MSNIDNILKLQENKSIQVVGIVKNEEDLQININFRSLNVQMNLLKEVISIVEDNFPEKKITVFLRGSEDLGFNIR